MNNKEDRQELINFMEKASLKGYQCFILKEDPSYLYGFFITPNDNVLYIQRDYFSGWTFTLKYVPSRQNGQGCQCLESPVSNLSITILEQAEREGLQFAYKLKAELYKNSQQFLKKLWNPDSYIQIIGEVK